MKKILVVIDMQNDFIDGSLGTEEAEKTVGNVVKKIEEYIGSIEEHSIYMTRDTHGENYLETAEGRALPVSHCIKNTKGWQINKDVYRVVESNDNEKIAILDKPTFGSEELANILYKESQKEEIEIELVGLCTDICVVSNALLLKAKMPEVKISVDERCCAGVTPETHKAALMTMKMCQIEVEGENSKI